MKQNLKISIILPSYNQSNFVEAALKSILQQDYQNFEIIFIDGGSSDDTMKVVDCFRDQFAHCISEADKGQSDALRKGFSLASGQILTWLNTDDLLLPGALTEIALLFANNPTAQVVFGNSIWINSENCVLKCQRSGEMFKFDFLQRLGFLTAGGPAAFFTREIYDKAGGINLNLHYMMDTELWWRFAMMNAHFMRSKRYIWALRLHAGSKVSGHLYNDPLDLKQVAIAKSREREAQFVRNSTKNYVFPVPFLVTRLLRSFHRLLSLQYWYSKWQNHCWKGKELDCAVKSLCPK